MITILLIISEMLLVYVEYMIILLSFSTYYKFEMIDALASVYNSDALLSRSHIYIMYSPFIHIDQGAGSVTLVLWSIFIIFA